MLTYINNGIDAIETAKKTFVQTFVPNAEFQKPFNTYIEAQAKFAREAAASLVDFATTVGLAAYSTDLKKAFAMK
jgi:hypothetical protein